MDLYQQNILDHYHHPKHKGKLPVADRHNEAANTLCGDKVELWIKIDNEKITTVGWDGEGCVLTQAACSLLCEKLINKSITGIIRICKCAKYTCKKLSPAAPHQSVYPEYLAFTHRKIYIFDNLLANQKRMINHPIF